MERKRQSDEGKRQDNETMKRRLVELIIQRDSWRTEAACKVELKYGFVWKS